jgi:hypothetical protein
MSQVFAENRSTFRAIGDSRYFQLTGEIRFRAWAHILRRCKPAGVECSNQAAPTARQTWNTHHAGFAPAKIHPHLPCAS